MTKRVALRIHAVVANPVDYFREAEWTAGVIGLGYVGLPLALTAS